MFHVLTLCIIAILHHMPNTKYRAPPGEWVMVDDGLPTDDRQKDTFPEKLTIKYLINPKACALEITENINYKLLCCRKL